jgi:hypothetical protein
LAPPANGIRVDLDRAARIHRPDDLDRGPLRLDDARRRGHQFWPGSGNLQRIDEGSGGAARNLSLAATPDDRHGTGIIGQGAKRQRDRDQRRGTVERRDPRHW